MIGLHDRMHINTSLVRAPRQLATAALLVVMMSAGTSRVHAQARAEHVPDPGRSAAGSDDALALVYNPANIAMLPGADLRWTWVRTGDGSPSPARGHAFAMATALPFGLGTGIRMDFVRPPEKALSPYDDPYTWLTWGLALGGETGGLGLAINHVYGSDPKVGGPTSISLGWTGRPVRHFGLAAVAHDINAPRTDTGARIDASYTLGAVVRPLGTRTFELGLEGRYFDDLERAPSQDDRWVPRATLGLDVPSLGRLRGDVSLYDPTEDSRSYVATASLDIVFPHMSVTGGAIWGSAIGGEDGAGLVTGLGFTSYREPGISAGTYAQQIRVEDTPDDRGHVAFLRRLWALSEDHEVGAVVLQIKSSPASSLAHAHELDDAVRLLQARGKKVVCHFEDAGGRALHSCAHADRIVINPAGGIRFAGLYIDRTYLAGLMQKLGIRAEFVRVGSHKSAPEQFTNTGPSEVALQDYRENLAQTNRELLAEIGRGRKLTPHSLRGIIDVGPFTAREALRHRLVDGYAYDDELRTVVSEVLGHAAELREDPAPDRAPTSFGLRPSIALIYVEGTIVDGRSQTIPILGMRLAGSYTLAESLKQAREDPFVSAIVLRIESPGGSSMASDVMWREVELTARQKPVVVSMGGVAASGGYYIAAPARKIFATPYTVTGSIGIFYGKADIAQLLGKIGVNVDIVKTSPRADAESIYRPFTPEEVEELKNKVKQFYDVFISRVAAGRKMTADEVDAVARGRVWMGRAAQSNRLVDEIGGLRQALAEARKLGNLPDDAPIMELPPPEFSLLRLVAKLAGAQESATVVDVMQMPMSSQVRDTLRALAPFLIYAPDQPLALSEYAVSP